jgi:uncharacterized RDD family membrane protein YckC
MPAPEESASTPVAGVFRRLGAMVYDSLLLLAVLLVASIPPVLLNDGPMRDGTPLGEFKNTVYLLYLLLLIFLFYGWFWTRNGQTLGMAAWRIRAISENGSSLNWRQVLIRLGTALLGLANLWIWFSSRQQGWHERLSRTRTVRIP